MVAGEKEPRPGTQTCGLCSNAEFQPREPLIWPLSGRFSSRHSPLSSCEASNLYKHTLSVVRLCVDANLLGSSKIHEIQPTRELVFGLLVLLSDSYAEDGV